MLGKAALKALSERAAIQGYGIDQEKKMIEQAKSKCPGMQILVSGCTRTPFADGQFDVVTACMAFHHFEDQKGFAREAARIVKPSGQLYIVDPRYPFIVRRPLNFALRLHKIAGYFATPRETAAIFAKAGFAPVDTATDGYAQCVRLRKAA